MGFNPALERAKEAVKHLAGLREGMQVKEFCHKGELKAWSKHIFRSSERTSKSLAGLTGGISLLKSLSKDQRE